MVTDPGTATQLSQHGCAHLADFSSLCPRVIIHHRGYPTAPGPLESSCSGCFKAPQSSLHTSPCRSPPAVQGGLALRRANCALWQDVQSVGGGHGLISCSYNYASPNQSQNDELTIQGLHTQLVAYFLE